MYRFKVGQKVVRITDSHTLNKGGIYVVDGFSCCVNCGLEAIYIRGYNQVVNNTHNECGLQNDISRKKYDARAFAPLQNNTDAIEYRLNVSIKELEVKEYQNQ